MWRKFIWCLSINKHSLTPPFRAGNRTHTLAKFLSDPRLDIFSQLNSQFTGGNDVRRTRVRVCVCLSLYSKNKDKAIKIIDVLSERNRKRAGSGATPLSTGFSIAGKTNNQTRKSGNKQPKYFLVNAGWANTYLLPFAHRVAVGEEEHRVATVLSWMVKRERVLPNRTRGTLCSDRGGWFEGSGL